MKKRLMIANAMVNEPDFLILDEPFEGLDPRQRMNLKNLINEYKKTGKTILISSHEIFEFQNLCENAIFLKDGTISYCGLIENINFHTCFNLENEK
jgi:ABC-2 type transport system ATP-binding protein